MDFPPIYCDIESDSILLLCIVYRFLCYFAWELRKMHLYLVLFSFVLLFYACFHEIIIVLSYLMKPIFFYKNRF